MKYLTSAILLWVMMVSITTAQSGTYIVTFLVDQITSEGDNCPPNMADLYTVHSGSEVDVTFAGNSLTLSHPVWGDLNLITTDMINYAGQEDFVSYSVTAVNSMLDGSLTGTVPGCTLTLPFTLNMGPAETHTDQITTVDALGTALLDAYGIEDDLQLEHLVNCGDIHLALYDDLSTILPVTVSSVPNLGVYQGITSTGGVGKTTIDMGGIHDLTPCEDVWAREYDEFDLFDSTTEDTQLDAIVILQGQALMTLINLNGSQMQGSDDVLDLSDIDIGFVLGGTFRCEDDNLYVELPGGLTFSITTVVNHQSGASTSDIGIMPLDSTMSTRDRVRLGIYEAPSTPSDFSPIELTDAEQVDLVHQCILHQFGINVGN